MRSKRTRRIGRGGGGRITMFCNILRVHNYSRGGGEKKKGNVNEERGEKKKGKGKKRVSTSILHYQRIYNQPSGVRLPDRRRKQLGKDEGKEKEKGWKDIPPKSAAKGKLLQWSKKKRGEELSSPLPFFFSSPLCPPEREKR